MLAFFLRLFVNFLLCCDGIILDLGRKLYHPQLILLSLPLKISYFSFLLLGLLHWLQLLGIINMMVMGDIPGNVSYYLDFISILG